MSDTETTFDNTRADGIRTEAGYVGVDSGTMVIGALHAFGHEDDDVLGYGGDRVGADWVSCTSGMGDGGYDVLMVKDSAGNVIGLEVVFLSNVCEEELERRTAGEPDMVSEADLDALRVPYQERNEEQTAAADRVNDSFKAKSELLGKIYDEMLLGIHPSADGEAVVLGEITLGGTVGVGDPCYGGPSVEARMPQGRYDVVTWKADAGMFGRRNGRLGVYLQR